MSTPHKPPNESDSPDPDGLPEQDVPASSTPWKAAPMVEGIVERSPGSWFYLVYEREPMSGRRRQVWVGGSKTRTQARQAKFAHKHLVRDKSASLSSDTVADLLMSYLESLETTRQLAPGTLEGYRSIVTCHLIPSLGAIKLRDLEASDTRKMVEDLLHRGSSASRGPLHPATVRKALRLLNGALRLASASHLIAPNAIAAGADIAAQAPFARRPTLTVEQVATIWDALDGHWFQVAFVLAVSLGLRRGEISALRWGDLDLDGQVAEIHRSISSVNGSDIERRTKERRLPIPREAIAVLRKHRASWERQLSSSDERSVAQDRVLVGPNGRPLTVWTISLTWRRLRNAELLANTGAVMVDLRDLRGSFAALAFESGMSVNLVYHLLGRLSLGVSATAVLDRAGRERHRPGMGRWETFFDHPDPNPALNRGFASDGSAEQKAHVAPRQDPKPEGDRS
jgi:integrase